MKELYTSPVITVEELTKVDVLCDSQGTPTTTTHKDSVLADLTNVL